MLHSRISTLGHQNWECSFKINVGCYSDTILRVAVAMTPHRSVICTQNVDTQIWCHHHTLVFTAYTLVRAPLHNEATDDLYSVRQNSLCKPSQKGCQQMQNVWRPMEKMNRICSQLASY